MERRWRATPLWIRRTLAEIAAVTLPAVAASWAVPPHPWSLTAALIGCALLPLRHIRPELAVIGVLPAVASGLGWPAAAVALYALGRRNRRGATIWPWVASTVLVAVGSVMYYETLPWQRWVLTFTLTGLIAGAPALLGMLMSTRERLTTSLQELRRAREDVVAATRETARTQERARIGREIHDSVGHHVTLIAVSAAALSASTTDPSSRDTAEQIRELAKSTIAEMRTALGLIDEAEQRAGSGAEVTALVAGARAAGVDVDVVHEGKPLELGPAVGRAVYRVVQESLTNAVRHAPGASVELRYAWEHPQMRLQISNPLPSRAPRAADRGGRGLSGIIERVQLVGGHVDAGPRGDSFTVTATFPQATAAAAGVIPLLDPPAGQPHPA
ncbi:sensor histidine kinase [Pseudonocardia sp. CA-107938]|uniref:sensor histidine kinase n=1 Tax=Pseudonocardia sp. CA-107938 TaxID=3240021 RepID=UPI003D8E804F